MVRILFLSNSFFISLTFPFYSACEAYTLHKSVSVSNIVTSVNLLYFHMIAACFYNYLKY